MNTNTENKFRALISKCMVKVIDDIPPCTMTIIQEFGIFRVVVGSGVSVFIFDRRNHLAGMNNFLFPVFTIPRK
jgi:chemotaxis receptor (MCP) glutamine deamidase CheD